MNVQQRRDLGCINSRQVITISEEKVTCSSSQVENFWELLGGTGPVSGAGHPDEDELFESAIIATNMVYEIQDNELVPVMEYWGTIPKIEMLDPNKVSINISHFNIVFEHPAELVDLCACACCHDAVTRHRFWTGNWIHWAVTPNYK
jgi:hypothetical protein